MFLAGIWLLGLIALGAVIQFERQVDGARQAQVVIAQMRDQQGELLAIAFDPATADTANAPGQKLTATRLSASKRVLNRSVATLAGIGNSDEPARIAALNRQYFQLVDHLSTLVGLGASRLAALELGTSRTPGGIQARLNKELDRADTSYVADAASSRKVASIGTVIAIMFLLIAFSIAFYHSVKARRDSHRDATTDDLTGLGNRRKLFADMGRKVTSLTGNETVTVGMFDLDGFKAYNDTFGHPAGDALLAHLGIRLAATVGDQGSAYRIGGDEFVVITTAPNDTDLLKAAKAALREQGEKFTIGCSLGSTQILAGITLEQALHVADQRLYTDKRSSRRSEDRQAHDVLLQVLAESSETLAAHVSNVGKLAAAVAHQLGLSDDEVTLARLTAELHDIGKTAIPDAILNKPGPLNDNEWLFMKRHTIIGERILAAAPALAQIAPLVRATHERSDGTGYPDKLHEHQIPLTSRIVAVVDAYDAMTSKRAYRTPMTNDKAITELRRCAGSQFDPNVTEAFITICGESTTKPTAAPSAKQLTPIAA